ncbi:MAG: hypothetical protein JNK10_04400 [Cyclobacteriaceae bacterium]|nr:hypothetical protein [Cyclobacteriaceae bacterium]
MKAGKIALVGWMMVAVGLSTTLAQTTETKPHRWTVYGGIGPNYYFNNLETASQHVTEVNYSFVTRIMWEPEHFLSLGFETGYNRLYSLSGDGPVIGKSSIVNVAVPLQVVVSMKFFDDFYANFNLGQAILLNRVTTQNNGDFHATVLSLGDFAATIGYRKDISPRFRLGTELKAYYSSKLNDKNLSLLFMAGYRLW